MRQVDVRVEATEGRIALKPPPRLQSLLWTRVCAQPGTVFILLSLVFGTLIVFATPPLRGPDEIAHFLRICSYVRGTCFRLLRRMAVRGFSSSMS
jgi:hypothetical protein